MGRPFTWARSRPLHDTVPCIATTRYPVSRRRGLARYTSVSPAASRYTDTLARYTIWIRVSRYARRRDTRILPEPAAAAHSPSLPGPSGGRRRVAGAALMAVTRARARAAASVTCRAPRLPQTGDVAAGVSGSVLGPATRGGRGGRTERPRGRQCHDTVGETCPLTVAPLLAVIVQVPPTGGGD